VTAARKFRVKSRLASLAFRSGGVTASQALKQADAAVETLREPSLETIDSLLVQIDERFGPGAKNRSVEAFDDLYLLCSNIIDVSLYLPGSGLDEAARACCELVDLSGRVGAWDWTAVDVHIGAMKVLRSAGMAMSDRQRSSILEGLAKVTHKRVGDRDAV
jgi:hypothetical protein